MDGLPVSGQRGSLSYSDRFSGDNAVADGAVSAKTGWIETGYTLSGVVRAQDGATLTFAIYALGDVVRRHEAGDRHAHHGILPLRGQPVEHMTGSARRPGPERADASCRRRGRSPAGSSRSTRPTRRSCMAVPANGSSPRPSSDGWPTRGFVVRLVGADPGRPSVLARRRGTGGGRTLLLAGHLDTVGGAGTGMDAAANAMEGADAAVARTAHDQVRRRRIARPWRVRHGGRTRRGHGRAANAAPADLAGDLVLAFAADEEFGSVGMEELLVAIDAEAAASEDPRSRPTPRWCSSRRTSR